MRHFSRNNLDQLDRIYRMNLINCSSGFKSANLIGTFSPEGSMNLAVFSSVTHLGSNPPLLGFILRPTKVPRHTYDNIKRTEHYTINHITRGFAAKAHHTSAKYDAETSEFEVTGLQPEFKNGFSAPYIKDSPVQIGMRLIEEHKIRSNDTRLIIGKLVDLYVKEQMIGEDGFIDLSLQNTAAINGLDGYLVPGELQRFGYQRPGDGNFNNHYQNNNYSEY